MIGFVIGAVCLVALVATSRRRHFARHGFGGWGGGFHRGWHDHGYHRGHEGGAPSDRGDEEASFRGFGMKSQALRWLFTRLDTTPGQEKVIAQAIDDVREELKGARGEWKATRDDIGRAVASDVFDENAIDAVFTRHDDALVKVRVTFKSALARVHDALTTEQRKELASLLGKFRGGPGMGPYRM